MLREAAYAIFIILLIMSSSFLLILSVSWNLRDSSLRGHSLALPGFLFYVDSLPFRSAVQLHPRNFFFLDSWVSATVFLCISYFLGFSPLFCILLNRLHDIRIRGPLFESLHIWKCLYFAFILGLIVSLCRLLQKKSFFQSFESFPASPSIQCRSRYS